MNSPRMKRFGQFLLVIFALVCVLMTAAFAEGDVEHTSFVWGTVASLLPPVAAIVLALITKEVYSSLFLGIIVGCFLYTNGSPIDAFQDFVSRLTSNAGGNMGILMFLVILGTMVALMIRAGGSKAYGDWAVSHIKTKSGALWSTFILAIVLGVDDYFNNLTTGNVMRPVTDGHHISRAKLSYMCDATAAPVCIMMPVSSWAAAVTGIIGNKEVGFQIFLKAIPYNYYAILTLVFIVVMTCLNIDYGPMRKHENNAAKGDLYTTPERPFAGVEEMKFNPNGKVIDLVLPVLVLVGCCVGSMVYVGYQNGGTDLITAFANTSAFDALPLGSLVALIFTMIFFMVRRAMSFTELMDCLPNGFKQMVPAILILCLAWTIGDVTKALGAPEFVADLVSKFGPGLKNFLPAVVFLIAAFLGFATGTSWGTFTILLPIVIPVFSGGIPAADLDLGTDQRQRYADDRHRGHPGRRGYGRPLLSHLRHHDHGILRRPMLPPQPRGDSAALRHDGGRRVLRKLHSGILYSECGYQSGHCHCVYGSSPAGDRQAEPLHEPPLPARLKSAELIQKSPAP